MLAHMYDINWINCTSSLNTQLMGDIQFAPSSVRHDSWRDSERAHPRSCRARPNPLRVAYLWTGAFNNPPLD